MSTGIKEENILGLHIKGESVVLLETSKGNILTAGKILRKCIYFAVDL